MVEVPIPSRYIPVFAAVYSVPVAFLAGSASGGTAWLTTFIASHGDFYAAWDKSKEVALVVGGIAEVIGTVYLIAIAEKYPRENPHLG